MTSDELDKLFYSEKERRFPNKIIPPHIEKEISLYDNKIELKFGDNILYQITSKINGINYMSYPKIGIFIGYNIADMALVSCSSY